jgi:hypothetical protein
MVRYVRPTPTGPDRARRREIERARRRRGRVRLALVAVLCFGLLAAAFALGRSSSGAGDDQPVVIDCVQRTLTIAKWPPEGWEKDAVIDGPVTFVGARNAERAETKGGRVTAELPVLVDAEKQVTIRADSDDVKMSFGDDPARAGAITLKACPSFEHEFGSRKTVGKYTQFSGDFEADEPTCVELEIQVYGEENTRHAKFGLGESCD